QLVEDALEELQVTVAAMLLPVDLEHTPGSPGVNRGIDVAECPFVRGHLAVRMHVPFAGQQNQLLFGEGGIQVCQRYAVKCQVPSRIPGVLPLVRHGQDVGVVEMRPLTVAPAMAAIRRWRLRRISVQPFRDVEIEELLAPDHSREGLALDSTSV